MHASGVVTVSCVQKCDQAAYKSVVCLRSADSSAHFAHTKHHPSQCPACAGIKPRDWHKGTCPAGVLSMPPVVAAASWHVRANNGGEVAVLNAIERVTQAQDDLMDLITSGSVGITDDENDDAICAHPPPAVHTHGPAPAVACPWCCYLCHGYQ